MKKIIALFLVMIMAIPALAIMVTIDNPQCENYNFSRGSANSIWLTCIPYATTPPVTPPVVPPVTPPVTPPASGFPATCGNLTAAGTALDWTANNKQALYDLTMTHGQARMYSFTTGPAVDGVVSAGIAEYAGFPAVRTIVISESPCDFDISNLSKPSGVATSYTVFFTVGVYRRGYATLKPNTVYYANIKNEDPRTSPGQDTCAPGVTCSFTFNISH